MKNLKKIFIFIIFSIFFNQLYSQENIHDFLENLYSSNYVIDFYFDVLKSGNRESIHRFSDVYVDREYPDPDYGVVKYNWYDMYVFPMDIIEVKKNNSGEIEDKYFSISRHWIDIENVHLDKNFEIIFKEGSDLNDWYDDYSSLDWKKIRQKKFNSFYFNFEGDYLYIYLNGYANTDIFAKFVRMDDKTLAEFKKLISDNTINLSNVTWPHHADGSCDYDGSKTTVATQTANSTTSTNIEKNKTMLVTENLKLRSGEATSTQVLTVMSAGTKVKILELGKAETIDGISSNWVKVEVQKGAKDRDGNPLKTGTVGWCYGGYLE